MAGTTSLQSSLSQDSKDGPALPFSWARVWNNVGNCQGGGEGGSGVGTG